MICPKCQTSNEPGSAFCIQCGASLPVQAVSSGGGVPQPDIPNYMVQSILVTLCCCLPLGIVGIVNAGKIDKLKATGDYTAAAAQSKQTKTLLMWGAIVGGALLLIYLILVMVGAISGYHPNG